jgi:hypothetical protein
MKITMGRKTKMAATYSSRDVTSSRPKAWKRCAAFMPQFHSSTGAGTPGASPPRPTLCPARTTPGSTSEASEESVAAALAAAAGSVPPARCARGGSV